MINRMNNKESRLQDENQRKFKLEALNEAIVPKVMNGH